MKTATCSSCGAEIIWAVTDPGGKRMPVDAKPEKRLLVNTRLNPDRVTIDGPFAKVVDTYVSHFATCPNAAQHRSKR